ncbi:MAG: hypothetical protein LBV05_12825 [Comamonas sp.]|jgi:hypothetical protein|uniref:hypothetical protein n=1 Tax=Comamonas sp. TaxID=34028 RepID=UPI0028471779|nr:hypothetical protein [Comamonas sp.]MDR3066370.1 hypothetical protein [Comamonas sp.]
MIWNPHTLGILGRPSQIGAVPPVVRSMGGVASTEQLSLAQTAYARFCDVVRTSQAPNPSAQGQLQDGTPYKIAVIGNTTVMTLWVAAQGQADAQRARRGISFQLMSAPLFDGPRTLIPQHSDLNGAPLIYLLTPEETATGSRVSSGAFRVGTVSVAEGGSITKSDLSGARYICGVNVGGRTHAAGKTFREKHFVSLEESIWSASRDGSVADSTTGGDGHYHSGSKPVNAAGDVQFIYTPPRGDSWIFGITTTAVQGQEAFRTRLQFYATPWSKRTQANSSSDDFLKWEGDIDEALWSESLTFSADGSQGKVHYGFLGAVGVIDFIFTPDGLSFTKSPKLGQESVFVDRSPPPIEQSNSYGFYDDRGNWIATGGDSLLETRQDTEKTTIYAEVGDYYDRTGERIGRSREKVVESAGGHQRTLKVFQDSYAPGMPPSSTTTQHDASSSVRKTSDFRSLRYGTAYEEHYSVSYAEFDNDVAADFYRRGASSDKLHSVDVRTLFLDDAVTDFWAASMLTTDNVQVANIDIDGYGVDHGVRVTRNTQRHDLVLGHRGSEIFREEIFRVEASSSGTGGEGGPVHSQQFGIDSLFSVQAAVDVKTDCMLVVIDKYHPELDPSDGRIKNIFDAEWVYVVGKNYIKPLHEVMEMAPGARITGLKTI